MGNLYLVTTALTGGTSGALDAIDGDDLSDGDAAKAVLSTGVYHYHLNASSSDSESSPYVIVPDTNPGTKRWELVSTKQDPVSHVRAKSSVTQSIPTSTNTKLIRDTVDYDTLSEYDETTGTFTATYDGIYAVRSNYIFSTVAWPVATYTTNMVYVNGSAVHYGYINTLHYAYSLPLCASVTGSVELSAGDYIEFYVWHNNGSSRNISSSQTQNWCTIDRLI
jgi:hypothetical protein